MISKPGQMIRKAMGSLYVDTGDISDTVFLAGCGRSGTTWLEDLLNYDNSFRIMFEPFHSLKNELLKGWNYRQYLRPGNRDPKFIDPATAILSGKVRNSWIDKSNRNHFASRRLIKDIRANLILKWIKHNFPQIPIILLMRHPCAVVHSKLKIGWGTHLEDFLAQEDLIADFLVPFRQEIEGANDLFDRHIFMWCIENYIPLNQFEASDILVIFYEHMCLDPVGEMERSLPFIGRRASSEIKGKFGKASSETRKDSAINSGEDIVSSWRKGISEEKVRRAVEILTLFGLHKIYAEGDLPLVKGEEALQLFPESG